MTAAPNRRPAFTLVEMMVASALIIFMMYIITSAFQSGLTSFRVLKAQGDMQEKLRAVATALRTDLSAPHFGGRMDPSNQGPFLSDHRLNDHTWTPPQEGYFRISLPPVTNTVPPVTPLIAEGQDPDGNGLQYYRLSELAAQQLYLQFTVNLTDGHPATRDSRGRRDQHFTSDAAELNPYSRPDYNVGSVPFTSNWAEVTYFLQRNSQTTDGVTPLFTLFRRQKLLVEPNPRLPVTFPVYPPGETDSRFPDVSKWYTGVPALGYAFNRPSDVTAPVRRWGMNPVGWNASSPPPAFGLPQSVPFHPILVEAAIGPPVNPDPYSDLRLGQRIGGDVLLTDVVNFEVKLLWEPVRFGARNTEKFFPEPTQNPVPVSPADAIEPYAPGNPDYPFDLLRTGINPGLNPTPANADALQPRVFDTWSSNNDTSGAVAYRYGVDPTGIDDRDNVPLAQKASSFSDPDYANWNVGHFRPPPQSVTRTPEPAAPPSGPSRWVPREVAPNGQVLQQGQPTQPMTNIPLRVRVRAVQIKLRIWDRKTSQTRQVTIIQDL